MVSASTRALNRMVRRLAFLCRTQGRDQRFRQSLAGAPADMKARHRIAGHEFAALDPVDHGQKRHAVAAHELVDVLGAAGHIGFSPGPGPTIVVAELRKAAPVAKRQIDAVANPLTALFRRSHEEHAAKALAREAAEHPFLVAIEQSHGLAAIEQLERRGDAGDAASDDQDVAAIHVPPLSDHASNMVWLACGCVSIDAASPPPATNAVRCSAVRKIGKSKVKHRLHKVAVINHRFSKRKIRSPARLGS